MTGNGKPRAAGQASIAISARQPPRDQSNHYRLLIQVCGI
jgi:hypothetical protein